ncbi:MAG: energy transducer TonB [Gammaproteobacteria bacterium]|nr:energy transducer TonB [Pseudomonadales bacterium]
MNQGDTMKILTPLILALLLISSYATAAEQDEIEAIRRAIELRQMAALNTPFTRPVFLELCQGNTRGWCEGYFAAIVTAYQIPESCMPVTDMAPFRYGSLWELTVSWVLSQPQDSRFTLFEAISATLADEERCPMGRMGYFEPREYVPYSEAELQELSHEGDMRPLNPVAAVYPAQAQQDGITGWAQVSFTVTKTGTVENVQLVDSDPPQIFDEVSLEAAAKLRFKPMARNGSTVEVPNVYHVFRFPPEEAQ